MHVTCFTRNVTAELVILYLTNLHNLLNFYSFSQRTALYKNIVEVFVSKGPFCEC